MASEKFPKKSCTDRQPKFPTPSCHKFGHCQNLKALLTAPTTTQEQTHDRHRQHTPTADSQPNTPTSRNRQREQESIMGAEQSIEMQTNVSKSILALAHDDDDAFPSALRRHSGSPKMSRRHRRSHSDASTCSSSSSSSSTSPDDYDDVPTLFHQGDLCLRKHKEQRRRYRNMCRYSGSKATQN